jgi:hypothetical protein
MKFPLLKYVPCKLKLEANRWILIDQLMGNVLSLVIPAYNEIKVIGNVIQEIQVSVDYQIIVVDDGST